MKLAILGTRGIPNAYGGFEQFAEHFAPYMVTEGHDVTVYNSSEHPYKKNSWKGVKIVHVKDPEKSMGTVGQFIYDLNCILHIRKSNYDIVLQLGYTSSSIWGWLLSKQLVITNMDGLEWKRKKYGKLVRRFLKYAEYLGVKYSNYLIADSIGIQQYLKNKYKVESQFIAYGATIPDNMYVSVLTEYQLHPYKYGMLVARMEPENNVEVIMDGWCAAKTNEPLFVVGGVANAFGQYLVKKYAQNSNVKFVGGIYDLAKLDSLRNQSRVYFHGHSVGGTNPSLLEAMASGALIVAHDNIFNRSVLEEDALYFTKMEDVCKIAEDTIHADCEENISNNKLKIRDIYSWSIINKSYENYLTECLLKK